MIANKNDPAKTENQKARMTEIIINTSKKVRQGIIPLKTEGTADVSEVRSW